MFSSNKRNELGLVILVYLKLYCLTENGSGLMVLKLVYKISNYEYDYLYSSMVLFVLCSQFTIVTRTLKNSTYMRFQLVPAYFSFLKTVFCLLFFFNIITDHLLYNLHLLLKCQIVKEIGQDLSQFKCGHAHLLCKVIRIYHIHQVFCPSSSLWFSLTEFHLLF